jgi:hypothetical protein
LAST